jgi:hypothetical protein
MQLEWSGVVPFDMGQYHGIAVALPDGNRQGIRFETPSGKPTEEQVEEAKKVLTAWAERYYPLPN